MRLKGAIEKLLPEGSPSYGFILGDDGQQYFFLPSAVWGGHVGFKGLQLLVRVEFEPFEHPSSGRMRARGVRTLTEST